MKRWYTILVICALLLTGCSSVEEDTNNNIQKHPHKDNFNPLIKVNDDIFMKEDILEDYEDEYKELNDSTIEDQIISSDLNEDIIPEYVDIPYTDSDNIKFDIVLDCIELENNIDNTIVLSEVNPELNDALLVDMQYGMYISEAIKYMCKEKNINIADLEYTTYDLNDTHINEYELWKLKNGNTVIYLYMHEAGNDIKIKIGG